MQTTADTDLTYPGHTELSCCLCRFLGRRPECRRLQFPRNVLQKACHGSLLSVLYCHGTKSLIIAAIFPRQRQRFAPSRVISTQCGPSFIPDLAEFGSWRCCCWFRPCCPRCCMRLRLSGCMRFVRRSGSSGLPFRRKAAPHSNIANCVYWPNRMSTPDHSHSSSIRNRSASSSFMRRSKQWRPRVRSCCACAARLRLITSSSKPLLPGAPI